ncbi:MAG: hypothetical protein LBK06_01880 [Planctomycetaceae bacterium]|nr:hypothetical protein [Planctomycetaceae bacterium]
MNAKAVLKFAKLNTAAQQREAIVRGRSLLPYRLRYKTSENHHATKNHHTRTGTSVCLYTKKNSNRICRSRFERRASSLNRRSVLLRLPRSVSRILNGSNVQPNFTPRTAK